MHHICSRLFIYIGIWFGYNRLLLLYRLNLGCRDINYPSSILVIILVVWSPFHNYSSSCWNIQTEAWAKIRETFEFSWSQKTTKFHSHLNYEIKINGLIRSSEEYLAVFSWLIWRPLLCLHLHFILCFSSNTIKSKWSQHTTQPPSTPSCSECWGLRTPISEAAHIIIFYVCLTGPNSVRIGRSASREILALPRKCFAHLNNEKVFRAPQ